MTTARYGGKLSALRTGRLYPQEYSWYSFSLRAESLKNPVTTPGIDPGTVRLVAQRLNHYATSGPPGRMVQTGNTCLGPKRTTDCQSLFSEKDRKISPRGGARDRTRLIALLTSAETPTHPYFIPHFPQSLQEHKLTLILLTWRIW